MSRLARERLGVNLEMLEEVVREREVRTSLLRLLAPQPCGVLWVQGAVPGEDG